MSRAAARRTASRRRLLIRLRCVALPHFLVTVKPTRGEPPSPPAPWARICTRTSAPLAYAPLRAARKSARFLMVGGSSVRPVQKLSTPLRRAGSGRQLFAALGAAARQHLAATGSCHAGAEAVAAFADQPRGLISAFGHIVTCRRKRPSISVRTRMVGASDAMHHRLEAADRKSGGLWVKRAAKSIRPRLQHKRFFHGFVSMMTGLFTLCRVNWL